MLEITISSTKSKYQYSSASESKISHDCASQKLLKLLTFLLGRSAPLSISLGLVSMPRNMCSLQVRRSVAAHNGLDLTLGHTLICG